MVFDLLEDRLRSCPADVGHAVRAEDHAIDGTSHERLTGHAVADLDALFSVGGALRSESSNRAKDLLAVLDASMGHVFPSPRSIDSDAHAVALAELIKQQLQRLLDQS